LINERRISTCRVIYYHYSSYQYICMSRPRAFFCSLTLSLITRTLSRGISKERLSPLFEMRRNAEHRQGGVYWKFRYTPNKQHTRHLTSATGEWKLAGKWKSMFNKLFFFLFVTFLFSALLSNKKLKQNQTTEHA
jgi:hypothetical protein